MAREGLIPAFKVASDYSFKRDEIEKWMTDQRTGQRGANLA